MNRLIRKRTIPIGSLNDPLKNGPLTILRTSFPVSTREANAPRETFLQATLSRTDFTQFFSGKRKVAGGYLLKRRHPFLNRILGK